MTAATTLPTGVPFAPRSTAHPAPVLAAVPGTDGAEILRTAYLFATHAGAPLRVLVVAEPLPMYLPGTETVAYLPLAEERDRSAALLERARFLVSNTLGADLAKHVSVEVRVGEAAQTITATAREWGAAMIVVGLGRHRPIDRLLGSETALRIVRHADRPVLAVASAIEALPTHVVVATDFSPSSTRAAEAVRPLLGEHAAITYLHVWRRAAITGPDVVAAEQAYERSLPGALARLGRVVESPAGTSVHTAAVEGPTAERVLSFAREHQADLIVVGRRSHSWFDRLFVGSVTTAVLRGATCAVLVSPEPTLAEQDRLRRMLQGISEGVSPEEWTAQLDGFSRRNAGRKVVLEEDDAALGAQTVASGLPLLGVAYDPHDQRIELMLGEGNASGRRLAHSVGDIASVGVLVGDDGADSALGIRHGGGQTLLTFSAG